jgi:hypothetical protein
MFAIFSICGHFSMDVVACSLFGVDLNSSVDKDNEFLQHAEAVFKAQQSPTLALFSK